jgi:hypothetical protein
MSNGDGTVSDTKTGLMWQQSSDGGRRTWVEALTYCNDLPLGGYDDWRLPNIRELESLVDDSRFNPSIAGNFQSQAEYYWSSTTCAFDFSYAWPITFSYGLTYYTGGLKTSLLNVRCVRGGPSMPAGLLRVTSPNGGEALTKGQAYTITWSSENVIGTIKMDLYKGGTEATNFVRELASGVTNSGAYLFSPLFDHADGIDYLIRIEGNNGRVEDFSDEYFTIQSPTIDSDGDGTPDDQDGCPHDPTKIEPGLCGCGTLDTDTDADGSPNCFDFDDDNDLMPDDWEIAVGLNPLVKDSSSDADNDSFSNFDEYLACTDPRDGMSKPFVVKGDINADGSVNLIDAVLSLQIANAMKPNNLDPRAEVNGDGRIGLHESIYALQELAGLREAKGDKVLFHDNFNDRSLDPVKWTHSGNRVVEEAGFIKTEVTVTDDDGMLWSMWIEIDPVKELILERRVKVHYANEYLLGQFHVLLDKANTGYDPGNYFFGVTYCNYAYSSSYNIPKHGFYLVRDSANVADPDHQAKVSSRIEPVWDSWFNEKLAYNPLTGLLKYYINGELRGEFSIGSWPFLSSHRVQLLYRNFAWWTGHYQHFDDVSVKQADQTVPETDLNAGLIAYYPFNGNANDESGNGNHGSVTGAVPAEDRFEKLSSAYQFDGVNDYISMGDRLDASNKDLSVCVWIKSEDYNQNAKIVNKGQTDAGYPAQSGFGLGIVKEAPTRDICKNAGICFSFWDDYYRSVSLQIPYNRLTPGSNHFVVGTLKRGDALTGQMSLYLDGTLVGSATGVISSSNTNLPFTVGNLDAGPWSMVEHFKGEIDDLRIYDRALLEAEVRALYLSANPN